MRILKYLAAGLTLLFVAAPAYGHFLWINTAKTSGGGTTVQLSFGEEAKPSEANLLDNVAKAKLWIHEPGKEPVLQKLEKKVNGETGSWDVAADTKGKAVTAVCDYGVITRGENTFLLQYYSKMIDLTQPVVAKAFARTENLKLDVVPEIKGETCELTVLINGKPAPADSQVMVLPPTDREEELKTDANGKLTIPVKESGQFQIRARVREDVAGERDGKKYPYAMHYCTMTLTLAAKTPAAAAK